MRIDFWGTRGSIARPGPTTVRYGGNTSCVSIRAGDGTFLILDCGTGLFSLSQALMASSKGPIRGHIFIGHTHWDHIQGLPFFAPLFVAGNEFDIYAPCGFGPQLRETLAGQMQHKYFPVALAQLGATIRYHDLGEQVIQVGAVTVRTRYLNHTAVTLGYRIEADSVAKSILSGTPTKVSQAGAEQVMCFEGAEHMSIGNQAWGNRSATVGKVTLPAGAFTALQGDFFGTWDEMESACNSNPKLIYSYYDVLVREGKLRDAHQRDPEHNPEPDSNGEIMVASALNSRNPLNYLDLASTNFNHFSEQNEKGKRLFDLTAIKNPAYAGEINEAKGKFGHNIGQWIQMHMNAAEAAFKDGLSGKELGGVGIAMDAAACHYLTDAFAAGHMRVPRLEMYNEYQTLFRARARARADSLVDKVPNELDLAAMGIRAATSTLPVPVPRVVTDAVVDHLPDAMRPKISLAGVKAAIKARLYQVMDWLGDFIGEKVAGFSAKVLHDYDNEHGVDVHNEDPKQKPWKAKGDHNLAASKENEQIAIRCTAASAKHVMALHRAGKEKSAAKDKSKVQMPFISLKSITSLIPQIDEKTRNEGTEPGGSRDWHWKTMSPTYRAKIIVNAIESIRGTVESAIGAIKEKLRAVISEKVHELLDGLGSLAQTVAGKIDQIVDKILSYIPQINPNDLILGIMQ